MKVVNTPAGPVKVGDKVLIKSIGYMGREIFGKYFPVREISEYSTITIASGKSLLEITPNQVVHVE